MPERIRSVLSRGAALLVACSVTGAVALSSPAHAQPATGPAGHPATVGGAQLAGSGVVVSAPAAPLPTVPASAYVIADAGTGQVLAAKDPHGLLRPASTLKMLTAVALVPLLNPDATVVASQQATSVTTTKISRVRAAASIGLIVFAAAAAIVLILLRRRSPLR